MEDVKVLADKVVYDAAFQAACQRYAHAGGSNASIAIAAVKALNQAKEKSAD